MRPVRLELNGFGSFRDHTVVDFSEADYFALVGPTGSGKSTILDAITFCLYGSAPRWGRVTSISYVLAPTANRCTVSLIFDVGTTRYQVAREVRRVGRAGTTFQQKNPSLVRFHDHTALAEDPENPSEVLAGDTGEVAAAIYDILGLSFDDFCHCVVLPQGQFAQFLSATKKERQEILLRLLGGDQYAGIAKQAGARAAAAGNQADTLTKELERYSTATPAALAEAVSRVAAHEAAEIAVADLTEQIATSRSRQATSASRAEQASNDVTRLSLVRTPEGVGDLQDAFDTAAESAHTTREAADQGATAAAEAASAATSGPQRAALESAQERHRESADLGRRRPAAAEAAATADTELGEAAARAALAATAHEEAAEVQRSAQRDLIEVTTTRRALDERHRVLDRVTVPAEVAGLAQSQADAEAAVTAAATAAATAAEALEDARAAHQQSPALERIRDAEVTIETLMVADEDLARARTGLAAAATLLSDAEAHATQTRHTLGQAQHRLDAAQVAAGAAQLRPLLLVGAECPVCTHTVTDLPPVMHDPDLEAAAAAHSECSRRHQDAVAAHTEAARQHTEASHQVERRTEQRTALVARLDSLLPDPERPSGQAPPSASIVDIDRARQLLLLATQTREAGERRLADAQEHHTSAQRQQRTREEMADRVREQVASARESLSTTVGSLSALQPPALSRGDLATDWRTLATWAETQVTATAAELRAVAAQVAEAAAAATSADETLSRAAADARDAGAEHHLATRKATETAAELKQIDERLAALAARLVEDPEAEDLPQLFELCEKLRVQAQRADQSAAQLRERAADAAREYRAAEQRISAARAVLAEARDTVAALGPPRSDDRDLRHSWDTLSQWSRRLSADLSSQAEEDRTAAADAGVEVAALLVQLHHELTPLNLALAGQSVADPDSPPDLGGRVEVDTASAEPAAKVVPEEAVRREVAVRLEQARNDAANIRSNADTSAEIVAKIADATERRQVAEELARLLRSNQFPQWLTDIALDSLVSGASEFLRLLSGGQYDLTHKSGEFHVRDHADADQERSVRTLSGGETFQASLALALALSDQLVGMGGATKMESIFLDEGFGTLDPDSLETVAGTLENLAQGDRMVGVITHVAGLAERAPVRFQVRRDERTSVIVREDL